MAKPKKPTPNQAAWNKEVKRLEREMKRAQRAGREVPAGFIPETPARITTKRLNLIRSKTLSPKKRKPEVETRKPPRRKSVETPRRTRATGVEQEEPRKGRAQRPSADPELIKEKDRIRSTIYRARKRGYEAPNLSEILAAKPEGVSTLDYLRSLQGKELYTLFRYQIGRDAAGNPIYQTGVERRAEENWARGQLGFARRLQKQEASSAIPQEPDVEEIAVIDAREQYLAMLYQELLSFTPSSYWGEAFTTNKAEVKESIKDFIDRVVKEDGEYVVAVRLQQALSSSELRNHLEVVLYSSDEDDVEESYAAIATAVAGRPLTRAEAEMLTVDN